MDRSRRSGDRVDTPVDAVAEGQGIVQRDVLRHACPGRGAVLELDRESDRVTGSDRLVVRGLQDAQGRRQRAVVERDAAGAVGKGDRVDLVGWSAQFDCGTSWTVYGPGARPSSVVDSDSESPKLKVIDACR